MPRPCNSLTASPVIIGLVVASMNLAIGNQEHSSKCPPGNQITALKSAIWSNPTIPVCWERSVNEYPTERGWVRDSIKETWEEYSSVHFVGWNSCTEAAPGIHIGIADSNPHTKGLGNQLNGMKNGMMLDFTFMIWSPSCQSKRESCIRGIAVHEFGHAIGLAHEQSRLDTPNWCKNEYAAHGQSGDENITPWDTESVMNYCNPTWVNNGKLSQYDMSGLQSLYGKPHEEENRNDGKWTSSLTYSDPGCQADKISITIQRNNITGTVITPQGIAVPVQATLDDQSNLEGMRFQFNENGIVDNPSCHL